MEDKIIADAIWINPDRVSGQPCFIGTRIPITILFDWLEDNRSLEEFAEHWHVPIQVVRGVLKVAESGLLKDVNAA